MCTHMSASRCFQLTLRHSLFHTLTANARRLLRFLRCTTAGALHHDLAHITGCDDLGCFMASRLQAFFYCLPAWDLTCNGYFGSGPNSHQTIILKLIVHLHVCETAAHTALSMYHTCNTHSIACQHQASVSKPKKLVDRSLQSCDSLCICTYRGLG